MAKKPKIRTAKVRYIAANGRRARRSVGLGPYTKDDWQRAYDEQAALIARYEEKWGRPWPRYDLNFETTKAADNELRVHQVD